MGVLKSDNERQRSLETKRWKKFNELVIEFIEE